MRCLLLLTFLLPLAACDSGEVDPPPDLYEPPTPVDESQLVMETTEAALVQRRAQWDASGPDDYRFEVVRRCGCLENRVRYVVTVRGGIAREATRTTPTDSVTTVVSPSSVPYSTVDAVFDAAQAGFDLDPDEAEVGYRPSDGLPASVFIDPQAGRTEDELILTIAGFDAL